MKNNQKESKSRTKGKECVTKEKKNVFRDIAQTHYCQKTFRKKGVWKILNID